MKKKLLALFAIVAFVAAPTFANTLTEKVSDMKTDASIKVSETNEKIFNNTTHPTWSAGLALSTGASGLAVNYRLDPQITIKGVLGFDLTASSFNAEAFGMYKVGEFEIGEETFDINAGLGASLGLNSYLSLGVLGAGEVSYSFDDDLPIDVAFRMALGVQLDFNSGVSAGLADSVALIGTYRFI
jgi:hypothetical protein